MLPKKGIVFPNGENLGPYPVAIAYALQKQLGTTHKAIKIIMRWTGAGERTVKNWLAGVSGPSGQHLVDLIRHSDDGLEVLLILAGRQKIVAVQKVFEVGNKLAETVNQIDELMDNESSTRCSVAPWFDRNTDLEHRIRLDPAAVVRRALARLSEPQGRSAAANRLCWLDYRDQCRILVTFGETQDPTRNWGTL